MSQSRSADSRHDMARATTGFADALSTSTVARRARMPHVQYWARVRAGMDCPLRRGAWYRVVELTPGETVLEVNSRLLRVPRAFLQILPLRPPMWSLVRRRPDDAAPAAEDGKYAVCPSCCERSPVVDSASTLRCRRCGAVSAIAWSDSPWRAFEVLPGRPAAGALARARAVALRALATAFGLRP